VNAMGEGWPGRESLAHGAGVHVRTVERAIQRLERLGLVDVTRYRGRSRTNRYRLVFPFEKNATSANGEVSFSEFQVLWKTLGITPEKAAQDSVKGGPVPPKVVRSRTPIRGRAHARGGKGVTKGAGRDSS